MLSHRYRRAPAEHFAASTEACSASTQMHTLCQSGRATARSARSLWCCRMPQHGNEAQSVGRWSRNLRLRRSTEVPQMCPRFENLILHAHAVDGAAHQASENDDLPDGGRDGQRGPGQAEAAGIPGGGEHGPNTGIEQYLQPFVGWAHSLLSNCNGCCCKRDNRRQEPCALGPK